MRKEIVFSLSRLEVFYSVHFKKRLKIKEQKIVCVCIHDISNAAIFSHIRLWISFCYAYLFEQCFTLFKKKNQRCRQQWWREENNVLFGWMDAEERKENYKRGCFPLCLCDFFGSAILHSISSYNTHDCFFLIQYHHHVISVIVFTFLGRTATFLDERHETAKTKWNEEKEMNKDTRG